MLIKTMLTTAQVISSRVNSEPIAQATIISLFFAFCVIRLHISKYIPVLAHTEITLQVSCIGFVIKVTLEKLCRFTA